jgi:hypothetical protein
MTNRERGMSGTRPCPHCGTVQAHHDTGTLGSLTREVERLRGVAHTRFTMEALEDKQRIDDLTREVRYLRETVARLRGIRPAAPLP